MRHASDRSHVDTVDLTEELLSFVDRADNDHLRILNVPEETVATIRARCKVVRNPLTIGKLTVRLRLVCPTDTSYQMEDVSASLHSRNAEISGFGAIFVRWAAMVREISARSIAEAIIRFGLSRNEALYLQGLSWPAIHQLARGSGECRVVLQIDGAVLDAMVVPKVAHYAG